MRKIILMSFTAVVALALAGCGEMAHYRKTMATIKQNAASTQSIQRTQRTPLNIEESAQYATTPESKYYYELIKQHNIDAKAIPAVEKDPATDPMAKAIADESVNNTKKAMARSVKNGKFNQNFAMQVIKSAQENAKNPIRILNDIPADAERGHMSLITGQNTQYYKTRDNYSIVISYKTDDTKALSDRLTASIGAFLEPTAKWRKTLAGGKDMIEKGVKDSEKLVELARESLESAQKQNYSAAVIKQRQDHLDSMEASLKSQKEKLENFDEPKSLLYIYTYMKPDNSIDFYQVIIAWDDTDTVTVTLNKTESYN